jgi:hypothetical protein
VLANHFVTVTEGSEADDYDRAVGQSEAT